MVIYIDVLIFTNMLVNYCILNLTKKFLHINTGVLRLIISAFSGALFSLVVFLPINSQITLYLIRITSSALICLVAFYNKNIILYVKSVIATFCFSVIFCGSMILLYQTVKPDNMAIVNDTVYFQINPSGLIIISVVIYFAIRVIQRIFHREVSGEIVKLKFRVNQKVYECIGKIDTGCSVVEPFSQSPVIIVENSVANVKGIRVIPYSALGNSGIIKGIKCEELEIDSKKINKEIYIGVYNGTIDSSIKAIINSEILR